MLVYMFVVPIKTDHNYIMIKIGYTEKFQDKLNTLEAHYGTRFYFIKAKEVKGKNNEEEFHDSLKKKYPDLHEKEFYINGKKKLNYINFILFS